MKKVLIFSTFDNFFLKDLLVKLSKISKYTFSYILISEYKDIKSIYMRALTLGIFTSCKYLILNFYKALKRDRLTDKLNCQNIVHLKEDEKIIKYIKKNKIDLLLSINYPKKISKEIIRSAKFRGINLHLGHLPKYKGRFPVIRALINKEKSIYITIHSLKNKFDSGETINEKKVKILNSNIEKIYSQLYRISFKLIKQSLNLIFKKKFNKQQIKKNMKVISKELKFLDIIKFKYFNLN